MHVDADAVAGAVVVVQTGGPQRRAGDGVELIAAGTGGNARAHPGDGALEHQREIPLLSVVAFCDGGPTKKVRVKSVA